MTPRSGAALPAAAFLPVRVTAASSPTIEIERNGTTVRLRGAVEVELLVRVLDALGRASC